MKKKTKKKNNIKYISIIVIIIVGVLVAYIFSRPRYYNNYVRQCSKGWYYLDTIGGIFGRGCRECPKGHYCPGDDKRYSCEKVSKQLTTASMRSTSPSACNRCKDETKFYKNGKCVPCTQGYYCRGGTLNSCPTGKTTKSTGKKRYEDCVCKAGTYAVGTQCKSCPKCNGYQQCFTTTIGATSVNQCKGTVPAGKYITCNSSGCMVKTCEGDTYSKSKSVTFKANLTTTCSKCPNGQKPNANHSACEVPKCPKGQYMNNGKCVSCPTVNGTKSWFTSLQGSTSISQCRVAVPAGRNLKCDSKSCTSSPCPGNTYSTTASYYFKANLTVNCKSCGNRKATWDHTGCE